mgnify:CR=1 FL=1
MVLLSWLASKACSEDADELVGLQACSEVADLGGMVLLSWLASQARSEVAAELVGLQGLL